MSLLDPVGADAGAALGQLRSAIDQVMRLGGVAELAGRPAELRGAAQAWRVAAGYLRNVEQDVSGTARAARSFWQETGAEEFARQWSIAGRKLESLAADLDRGAQSLDGAAAQLDRETELVRTVVADIETVLGVLAGGGDPLVLLAAAQRAPALVGQLQELLYEIEAILAIVEGALRSLALDFVHIMGDIPTVVPEAVGQIWGGAKDHVGQAVGFVTGGVLPLAGDLAPKVIAYWLGFRVVAEVVGKKTYYVAQGVRILDGSLLGRWIMSGRLPGTRYAAGGVAITRWIEENRPSRMLTSLADFSPEGLKLAAKGAGPVAILFAALPDIYDYSPAGPKAKLGYGADFWSDVIIDEASAGAATGVGVVAGAAAGAFFGGAAGTEIGPEGTVGGGVVGGIVGTGAGIAGGLTIQGYLLANPGKHDEIHNFVRDQIILHPGDSVSVIKASVGSHLPQSGAPPNVHPQPTPGPPPIPPTQW
ncbi:MAG: WXG100 family type VII secretion target [Acidimicrobiaceae bacterium]|nr:WXG100 family type VII secretion target [Acidimicrobiaceae bacterium]